jgi:hypothetical protein
MSKKKTKKKVVQTVKPEEEQEDMDAVAAMGNEGEPTVSTADVPWSAEVEIPPPNEPEITEGEEKGMGEPVVDKRFYNFEKATANLNKGIKVCRAIWHPACFLTDHHRWVNPDGAILPWRAGGEDQEATDWMNYSDKIG